MSIIGYARTSTLHQDAGLDSLIRRSASSRRSAATRCFRSKAALGGAGRRGGQSARGASGDGEGGAAGRSKAAVRAALTAGAGIREPTAASRHGQRRGGGDRRRNVGHGRAANTRNR